MKLSVDPHYRFFPVDFLKEIGTFVGTVSSCHHLIVRSESYFKSAWQNSLRGMK